MFFTWGLRAKGKLIGQLKYPCSKCATSGYHEAVVLKRRFTFFFNPILPLGSTFFLTCNRCGLRLKAKGDLEKQLKHWHRTGTLKPLPTKRLLFT